jgi:hypothetical protein
MFIMRTFAPIIRLTMLLAAIAAIGPGTAVAESGSGWFSGISAFPFTLQFESENDRDGGSILSSNRSTDSMAWRSENPMSASQRSFLLGGSGTLSLNDRLGLVGRLGSFRTESDANSTVLTHGMADGLPYNLLGLGMQYNLGNNLHLQGGWDRYQLRYNRINGDAGVDLLTIGLKYRF